MHRTEKLNYEKVLEHIVNGMCKYLTANGIKAQVLGVSGGIDSTVSAAICYLVYEKIGVPLIGASLPCNTNAIDEVESATLCGKEFCNMFREVNIQELFVKTEEVFNSYGLNSTNISQGNIKARLRGSFLHNIASINNGIVIDTDNLSEHFLGFWTIAGGDVGELNPIGGLWKHEVYELADYMLKNIFKGSKALEASISLVPTDGNGVKVGGDLEQIAPGKTYNDVDDILYHWVNLSESIKPKYIADGLTDSIKNTVFDVEDEDVKKRRMDACKKSDKEFVPTLGDKYGVDTVRMVVMRSWNSEFKRKMMPLVVDIYNGSILEKNGKLYV